MKNYKIKLLISPGFLAAVAMLLIMFAAAEISAQADKTGKVKSQQDVQEVTLTPRKGKGKKDANLKPSKQKAEPRGSRGGDTVCSIEIKNTTQYTVRLYVDGREQGIAYSNSSFKTTSDIGRIKVYARTDLIKNNYLYWGPDYYTCGSSLKDGKIYLETKDAPKF